MSEKKIPEILEKRRRKNAALYFFTELEKILVTSKKKFEIIFYPSFRRLVKSVDRTSKLMLP